jgi:hypothetical protein
VEALPGVTIARAIDADKSLKSSQHRMLRSTRKSTVTLAGMMMILIAPWMETRPTLAQA